MPTNVDVYVDYVCPFCFLVEPALESQRSQRHKHKNKRDTKFHANLLKLRRATIKQVTQF